MSPFALGSVVTNVVLQIFILLRTCSACKKLNCSRYAFLKSVSSSEISSANVWLGFHVFFCLFSMLLRFAFSRLRSTQVAVVHCSAQTSSRHVLQKLSQTCLLLSSNTGRVFRPKDCENLVLYLKDINLPKPDKWGTSNLTSFLQQVKRPENTCFTNQVGQNTSVSPSLDSSLYPCCRCWHTRGSMMKIWTGWAWRTFRWWRPCQ